MAHRKSFFLKLIDLVNKFIRSFRNFFKSSIISLIIISIILLLLTQMDQAFTMMVDLLENNWISLFLSFIFINALAIVLSHYPIYTYYAANLNNSINYTKWKKVHPFKFWPLKRFTLYVFTTTSDPNYRPDNWANYLRYLIGLLIHAVWIHFIISSFSPNIIYENFPLITLKIFAYGFLLVPFILYIIVKEKFTRIKRSNNGDQRLEKIYMRLGIWYFIIATITLVLLILTLSIGNFSPGGLVLLLLTSYAFIFNYLFFRLLRTRLTYIKKTLQNPVLLPVQLFINRLLFLEKSKNYLLLFSFHFILAMILIIYSTISSIKGYKLFNGIPILLSFFYFYYFIIANLKKYFFVVKKMQLFNSRFYKIIFTGILLILIVLTVTNFSNIEVRTHELDLVSKSQSEIYENTFLDSLKAKKDNTLFFIASHGGGLKSNVWTLNVINKLQEMTQYKLLDQTIALSGASGGSLGLALYTSLYKEDGRDSNKIQKKIDALACQNYTSIDITMTFGLDSYRKIWPLNQRIGIKDRPYYAMVKYQNNIENIPSSKLSSTPFRAYWKDLYSKRGYFPSLIMNTAGTKGNRGILWSVKAEDFSAIFPYAENLADLENDKTLPYYQAVSTTNRFPIFSPAAKIPGYGHYIDAGAIDNSGLLGCIDLHGYLLRDPGILIDKQIAYLEIINSKSLYLKYLLEKFKKESNIDHISKNENETDNIIADIKTGLNLDKIPEYLSDYLTNLENDQNGKIRYFRIFMPHKVTMNDIEGYLEGAIQNNDLYKDLSDFLRSENDLILSLTEKPNKSFFEPWEYYEPTLSRHLSKSSLNYIKAILAHPLLLEQFLEIETIINTSEMEKDKEYQISF